MNYFLKEGVESRDYLYLQKDMNLKEIKKTICLILLFVHLSFTSLKCSQP